MPTTDHEKLQQHTEELQDIITAPPAWLLRWGILLFLVILLLVFGLSALIRYPDIVKTPLKINSDNSPKPVVSRVSGKLVRILVHENGSARSGQPIAYMESTAGHDQVLRLLSAMKVAQHQLFTGKSEVANLLNAPQNLPLGELQGSYQAFYQSWLSYKTTVADGFYLKKRKFLEKDLSDIVLQKQLLLHQQEVQQKEYELARKEYDMHKKLAEQKVEAQMELERQEGVFLAKQYPLQQTASLLLANSSNYSAKEKELVELDNLINQDRAKFIQVLNSFITEAETWKSKYILSAPVQGKVSFAGSIQPGQYINLNQEVFYINPGSNSFLGEMAIPQYNMGKVKEGQEVLVKLRGFPYEEYGILVGKIHYISDVPYRDSVFLSKVAFSRTALASLKRPVKLKTGMTADAEIITEDASLLNRISRNIIKMLQ